MKTLVIIPSRMSATRLPGKPLLKINGLSIISHVFKKAQEANIGEVIVATEDQEIVDDIVKNRGRAILTSNKHKTGTDRIYEALKKLDIHDADLIMNLQGDEPAINIEDINNLNEKMIINQSKMGTLAAEIKDIKNLENENILENKSEDYTNLLKINRLIENKFQKSFKEISDKTNFKIKDIKSNKNEKKAK